MAPRSLAALLLAGAVLAVSAPGRAEPQAPTPSASRPSDEDIQRAIADDHARCEAARLSQLKARYCTPTALNSFECRTVALQIRRILAGRPGGTPLTAIEMMQLDASGAQEFLNRQLGRSEDGTPLARTPPDADLPEECRTTAATAADGQVPLGAMGRRICLDAADPARPGECRNRLFYFATPESIPGTDRDRIVAAPPRRERGSDGPLSSVDSFLSHYGQYQPSWLPGSFGVFRGKHGQHDFIGYSLVIRN